MLHGKLYKMYELAYFTHLKTNCKGALHLLEGNK